MEATKRVWQWVRMVRLVALFDECWLRGDDKIPVHFTLPVLGNDGR